SLLVAGQSSARPTTFASAIRIAEPAHLDEVEEIVASGRAEVFSIAEDELQEAWSDLAAEGIFCEPASAAGLAALRKRGVEPGWLVVSILTGNGLKDPDAVERLGRSGTIVEPSAAAVLELLG